MSIEMKRKVGSLLGEAEALLTGTHLSRQGIDALNITRDVAKLVREHWPEQPAGDQAARIERLEKRNRIQKNGFQHIADAAGMPNTEAAIEDITTAVKELREERDRLKEMNENQKEGLAEIAEAAGLGPDPLIHEIADAVKERMQHARNQGDVIRSIAEAAGMQGCFNSQIAPAVKKLKENESYWKAAHDRQGERVRHIATALGLDACKATPEEIRAAAIEEGKKKRAAERANDEANETLKRHNEAMKRIAEATGLRNSTAEEIAEKIEKMAAATEREKETIEVLVEANAQLKRAIAEIQEAAAPIATRAEGEDLTPSEIASRVGFTRGERDGLKMRVEHLRNKNNRQAEAFRRIADRIGAGDKMSLESIEMAADRRMEELEQATAELKAEREAKPQMAWRHDNQTEPARAPATGLMRFGKAAFDPSTILAVTPYGQDGGMHVALKDKDPNINGVLLKGESAAAIREWVEGMQSPVKLAGREYIITFRPNLEAMEKAREYLAGVAADMAKIRDEIRDLQAEANRAG